MKLHAFEYGADPRYRAYTRDRGRKRLQHSVHSKSHGIVFESNQWRYVGLASTKDVPSDHAQSLHSMVRQYGFAVVRMPSRHTNFHVYDLQLDSVDVRIYSHDQNLTQFNKFRKRLELGPDGYRYGGTDPIHRGEIEISNEASAAALRLNDRNLQVYGFDVVVVGIPQREEFLRRKMQRELPEILRREAKGLGVELMDFRVIRIESNSRDPQHSNQAPASEVQERRADQSININVSNTSNMSEPTASAGHGARPRLFDGWIAKLLGLLAAIATIMAFFKS